MKYKEIKQATEIYRLSKLSNIVKEYKDVIKLYLDNDISIFRGIKSDAKLMIGDGTDLVRKAANTKNYVNSLLDVLPVWQEWPKRSKSFICSTSKKGAGVYGTLFLVIPLDNQSIGFCIYNSDFWDALPVNDQQFKLLDVSSFNHVINDLFSFCKTKNITLEDNSDNDGNICIKNLNYICDAYNDKKLTGEFSTLSPRQELYEYFIKQLIRHGVLEYLNKILDPNVRCDIKSNFLELKNVTDNRECWMSGKVLFIKYEYVDVLRQTLERL
jgi:hypothetical protein